MPTYQAVTDLKMWPGDPRYVYSPTVNFTGVVAGDTLNITSTNGGWEAGAYTVSGVTTNFDTGADGLRTAILILSGLFYGAHGGVTGYLSNAPGVIYSNISRCQLNITYLQNNTAPQFANPGANASLIITNDNAGVPAGTYPILGWNAAAGDTAAFNRLDMASTFPPKLVGGAAYVGVAPPATVVGTTYAKGETWPSDNHYVDFLGESLPRGVNLVGATLSITGDTSTTGNHAVPGDYVIAQDPALGYDYQSGGRKERLLLLPNAATGGLPINNIQATLTAVVPVLTPGWLYFIAYNSAGTIASIRDFENNTARGLTRKLYRSDHANFAVGEAGVSEVTGIATTTGTMLVSTANTVEYFACVYTDATTGSCKSNEIALSAKLAPEYPTIGTVAAGVAAAPVTRLTLVGDSNIGQGGLDGLAAALMAYDSRRTVTFGNFGHSGSKSADWFTANVAGKDAAALSDIQTAKTAGKRSEVFILLGTNDAWFTGSGATPKATYKSNIATLIDNYRTAGADAVYLIEQSTLELIGASTLWNNTSFVALANYRAALSELAATRQAAGQNVYFVPGPFRYTANNLTTALQDFAHYSTTGKVGLVAFTAASTISYDYPAPPPGVTSVSVAPMIATIAGGGTQQLTATVAVVSGAAQTVTWAVQSGGTTSDTVSSAGLFTAGTAGTTARSVVVRATSTVDNTKYGSATVTVSAATVVVPPSPAGTIQLVRGDFVLTPSETGPDGTITAFMGDTFLIRLTLRDTNGGDPVTLPTTATFAATVRRFGTITPTTLNGACTVIDAGGGVISYRLSAADTAGVGSHTLTVKMTSGDDTMTFGPLTISVLAS